jgi:hypothetical protein
VVGIACTAIGTQRTAFALRVLGLAAVVAWCEKPLSYRSWNVQVEQGSWSGDLAVVRT